MDLTVDKDIETKDSSCSEEANPEFAESNLPVSEQVFAECSESSSSDSAILSFARTQRSTDSNEETRLPSKVHAIEGRATRIYPPETAQPTLKAPSSEGTALTCSADPPMPNAASQREQPAALDDIATNTGGSQLPLILPSKVNIEAASLYHSSHLQVGDGSAAGPTGALLSSAPLTGGSGYTGGDPPVLESDSKEYGVPAHIAASRQAKAASAVVMVAAGALSQRPAKAADKWPLWQVILLAVLVGCEYGVASTTISLSGRLLGQAHWNVAMQLNTVGRVLGCLGILAIEACRGKLSRGQDGTSLLDLRGWIVALVSAAQTGMFIAVHFLASSGNVSVLLALTSLYNVVPPLYGIVRGGESLTRPKIAGFIAAAFAVALLSAASASGAEGGEPSTLSPLLQIVLVAVAIIGWGTTDTIFSRIGKSMPSTSTTMWYAIGNAGLCIVLAQLGAAARQVAQDPLVVTATPTAINEDDGASTMGYFALLGTNIVAMAGWYGFITLGRVADASTFVPIVAAILTVTPSIVGTVLLGESFTAMMGAGVAFAVASAVCMSLQGTGGLFNKQPAKLTAGHVDEDPRAKPMHGSLMVPSESLLSLPGAVASASASRSGGSGPNEAV